MDLENFDASKNMIILDLLLEKMRRLKKEKYPFTFSLKLETQDPWNSLMAIDRHFLLESDTQFLGGIETSNSDYRFL